jgi:hypothetical protein
MKGRLIAGLTLLTGLLLASGNLALAHHGSRISYDMSRMVTVEGVVTEFDYTNPHCYFLFDVTDDTGAVTHWAAETDPPSMMTRYNWNKNFLKPGDKVTVTVWPSKVGAPRGFLAKLVKADGTVTDHSGQAPPE